MTKSHPDPDWPEARERRARNLRSNLKGLQEETLSDFLAKNEQQHSVAPALTLDGQLLPVSEEDLRHIFRDNKGWDRFRALYPYSSGTVEFSRVGFNRTLTQALVYAGKQVDWRMGHGGYWLYARSGNRWVESGYTEAWVS